MKTQVVNEARSREVLGSGFDKSVQFADLLERDGLERGLIGPRELDRLWSRHIMNSAAVASALPATGSVADVGSGAGLPGVVLAAMRPDLTFTLIEPMERRVAWLDEVTAELNLSNVSVFQGQAQEVSKGTTFDVVTARAVAALDKLVRWTWPLVAPGGALLALKGKRAELELEAAAPQLRRLKVRDAAVESVDVMGDGELTWLVKVVRQS